MEELDGKLREKMREALAMGLTYARYSKVLNREQRKRRYTKPHRKDREGIVARQKKERP